MERKGSREIKTAECVTVSKWDRVICVILHNKMLDGVDTILYGICFKMENVISARNVAT